MKRTKSPRQSTKLITQAAQLLIEAKERLNPARAATLTKLDAAAANLRTAAEHLDQASNNLSLDPSAAVILKAAANAASAAHDHIQAAHKDLEDAYIADRSGASPRSIQATLRTAAEAAHNETKEALELLEEEGTHSDEPFAPPELTTARRNKPIMAICISALILAVGLAVYNPQGFTLAAAVATLASQQLVMCWAMVASVRPGATPRRIDFYACVAIGVTVLMAAALLLKGLGPRAALQLTGATFLFVMVEWAGARTLAFYTRKLRREGN